MTQVPAPLHRFTHEAMATHFEVLIAGTSEAKAASAARAIFTDIDGLESELTRFSDDSEIARLRGLRTGQRTRVNLATFDCLSLAKDVSDATSGAFDVAVMPLWEVWSGADGRLTPPGPEELEQARARSGSHLFDLDPESLSVVSHSDGLFIDLGGIGKGYALDQAADILVEWEISSALINAGDSTVLALDPPPGAGTWLVGTTGPGHPKKRLSHASLSGSGFSVKGSHIINPRTGEPVPVRAGREHVWAVAPYAALADALSTAFMVMSDHEIAAFCDENDGVEALHLDGPEADVK